MYVHVNEAVNNQGLLVIHVVVVGVATDIACLFP